MGGFDISLDHHWIKVYHCHGMLSTLDDATKDAFWSKVDKSGGPGACWPWTAGKNHSGHGLVKLEGRTQIASRVAFQLSTGRPLTTHACVLHRCGEVLGGKDNPACCNPDHLYLGTPADNLKDAYLRGNKVSKRGQDSHFAKLNESHAREVFRLLEEGKLSFADIAYRFGISESAISHIYHGDNWAHIRPVTFQQVKRKRTTALSHDTILKIQELYRGGMSQGDIAKKYGMAQSCISRYVRNARKSLAGPCDYVRRRNEAMAKTKEE